MNRFSPWIILLLPLFFLGCSYNQPGQTMVPADWQLSRTAQIDYLYLKAQSLKGSGEYPAAARALSKILKISPYREIYLELAELYWQSKDIDQAKATLKKAIELFPGDFELVQGLAQIYLHNNRPQAAKATLRSYLHNHPNDPKARTSLTEILLQTQDFGDAADTIQAIPSEDQTPRQLYLLGQAQSELGLLAHAAATLKRATKEDPDLAEAWAELGYVREQQRMFSKAIQAYSQLHDLQPDNHDLLLRLVKLNLKLNNPDQALRLFLNGPEDEDLRLQVVDILLQNGFYPQAQKALDRLTQKGDPSPKVFLFRAILAYESRQDLGKAIACLRQIPASASFYPQGLFLQGRIFMDSDQPQKALEVAKEGKQKFSDLPGFWVLHSDALRALDQPKQALQTITAALKHWPKDTELLYQQGFLYQALNRTKKAIATMEHIISLDPEHADALNFVGYSLAEQGRQLDRSLVLIKNAVELKPENGYIRDSLAWVYFQRQEYQEAWGAIQKAIDLQARDPIVWEHYGDIAAALNKTDKAKRGYEQALKSGSKDQARLRQKIKALEED